MAGAAGVMIFIRSGSELRHIGDRAAHLPGLGQEPQLRQLLHQLRETLLPPQQAVDMVQHLVHFARQGGVVAVLLWVRDEDLGRIEQNTVAARFRRGLLGFCAASAWACAGGAASCYGNCTLPAPVAAPPCPVCCPAASVAARPSDSGVKDGAAAGATAAKPGTPAPSAPAPAPAPAPATSHAREAGGGWRVATRYNRARPHRCHPAHQTCRTTRPPWQCRPRSRGGICYRNNLRRRLPARGQVIIPLASTHSARRQWG